METKLTTLVGEWQQVADMMMDMETDPKVILDTLEGIEGEIAVKADGYGDVIRRMEFELAAVQGKKGYVKGILDQLTKQEKHLENEISWMKDRLRDAMIATGLDEKGLKTDKYIFKVNGTGGQQALKTTDKVPEEFTTKEIIVKNDEKKIREYLKDHKVDWAWLLPRKRNLDIKGV